MNIADGLTPIETLVEVFNARQDKRLGSGKIVGYEPIMLGAAIWCFSPIIVLDNGLAIGGWECWWAAPPTGKPGGGQ